ncbi:MAG: ABC transporter ATP-binding protein [Desulfovibrio sp.]|nr:ABC transporter ATP-binding protein [Desulfovibrio sp.]
MPNAEESPFLTVKDVWKYYPATETSKFGKRKRVAVLKGLSFSLPKGRISGLLGESGSGKSTLSRLLLGLEKPESGEILLEGVPVEKWRQANPGKMSVVFQNYAASINPSFTIGEAIAEGFNADHARRPDREAILNLMQRTGLTPDLFNSLPCKLSGGQIQRVCIARAIAANPDFVVFDEAISALDAPVQVQIANLLKELHFGFTALFITHDIQIAALICHDMIVMHKGLITDNFRIGEPQEHASPYLAKLLDSTVVFHSGFLAHGADRRT